MNFIGVLGSWVNRYFSRPDAIFLVAAILAVSAVLYVLAGALAPVLTGLVIAFLLQGLVERLESIGCHRLLAIVIAMVVLIGSVFAIVLLAVPLVWQQASSLLALAPSVIGMLRDGLSGLAARFPEFITEEQILGVVNESSKELGNLSAFLLELEQTLPSNVVAHRIECHINDAEFADKALEVFDSWRASGFIA